MAEEQRKKNLLSMETRATLRTELTAINDASERYVRAVMAARANGEISQQSHDIIVAAVTNIVTNVAGLAVGLLVGYTDPSGNQREVTVPVSDAELPDINFITSEVPNN